MKEPQKPFSRRAQRLIGDFRGVAPDEPAKMQKRPTRELADVVEDLRVKHRLGRSGPEDAVREAWPDIVGQANSAYSSPLRIEGRRLIVGVSHPVVRNELFLHREEIVQRLKRLSACRGIAEVHLITA